jgi:hypothetical protein
MRLAHLRYPSKALSPLGGIGRNVISNEELHATPSAIQVGQVYVQIAAQVPSKKASLHVWY